MASNNKNMKLISDGWRRLSLVAALLCAFAWAQVKEEAPIKGVEEYLKNIPATEDAVKIMVDAIYQGSDAVKAKTIAVLSRMNPPHPSAIDIFKQYIAYGRDTVNVNMLRDEDVSWEIRANSAVGLSKLQNPEVAQILKENLVAEKNLWVQKALIYALGEVKELSAAPMLIRKMEVTTDETLIIECIRALGKMGSKETFLPLMKIAEGKYLPLTRNEARRALEAIKW